ncbi:MBL fold metallo-hydrolase [Desulfobacterales bacterium HSG2]|nr:MBL fold metallo-hydrolase [Desulfobacterales bacterium HSG2]
MNIRFWGVRGSIASPLTNAALEAKITKAVQLGVEAGLTSDWQIPEFIRNLPCHLRQTAGGDTACVEIQAGDNLLILDAGTGIRRLGSHLVQMCGRNAIEAHILLTHTHWDHISGIPFFVPGFDPNNKLIIYGPSPEVRDRVKNQQKPEYFPVPLAPAFRFVQLKEQEEFRIGDVRIETLLLNHPGNSYAYRITHNNKTVVYATDSEYKDLSAKALKPFTDFFDGADLLIYDAQFTFLESIEKEDWGHSNALIGVDMALLSHVKKLAFIHHDPTYDDKKLWDMLETANEYLHIHWPDAELQLYLAVEDMNMTI